MRPPTTGIVLAAAACITLTACSDDSISVITPAKTTILGNWAATVVEVADTCDDIAPPDLYLTVEIEPYDERHTVRFRDYGSGFNCWVMPFDVDEHSLSFSYTYNAPFDCSPGCRVLYQTHIELNFAAGGRFDGIETITYEPVTPECNVPECGLPCADPVDHMLWESRAGRGCGSPCQTTYRWEGLLSPQAAPQACGS